MLHTKSIPLTLLSLLKLTSAGDSCTSGRHCVCYDDIGECYSESNPWGQTAQRPIRALPDSPSKISPEFHLFTLFNKNEYKRIQKGEVIPTEFDTSKRTVVIVHGFLSDGEDNGWMGKMKDSILARYDYNVILVDWHKGANVGVFNLDYPKASQNTRVVGDILGQLIQDLGSRANLNPENTHCIGHSLGAHICGYSGKVQTLGRISGLDPAGPYFENTPDYVRLDAKDADFVDNVHTDGEPLLSAGFGMMQAIGDVDFYPNGGKDQPGCRNYSGCSHAASHEMWLSSIESGCVGTVCDSYDHYLHGLCGAGEQSQMGWFADLNQSRGSYYLETNSEEPWCKN